MEWVKHGFRVCIPGRLGILRRATYKKWRKILNYLIILLLLQLCGCREQIIHNLDEAEANKLITRLHQGGLPAQKVRQADGAWGLEVTRSDSMVALKLLSAARVLKNGPEAAGKKSDILSSREDQRFGYERAVSRELEATIESMSGVLESRVHLNLPPSDPIFGQSENVSEKASASVLVVTEAGFRAGVEQIQALVSGGAGVEASKVTVILNESGAESSGQLEPAANMQVHTSEQPQAAAAKSQAALSQLGLIGAEEFGMLAGIISLIGLSYGVFYKRKDFKF